MKQTGFTLLELLIVMFIIGILAALAYPSYSQHLFKVRRAEAKLTLLDLAAKLEQFHAIHHSYETTIKIDDQQKFYHYEINITADNFVINALPKGTQANDECGVLSINNLGQHAASAGPTTDCW